MEIDSDNVAEVEKYAFLLGSAIKNEDTEQFFSIYDAIIPKDLPDNQLEDIKARAREVAELPDGEFNDLVLRARHFSLAPAGTAMSCHRDTSSNRWTQPSKEEVGEEDDGIGSVGSYRYGSVSSGLPNEPTFYPSAKVRTESETKRFDTDSGVCNSSKASLGSLSDHDGSEDEGRGGSFDYYPPQIKIRSGCGLNLDYDEAHEVKSDHSSQDVNSPRSDISEGIEMTTYHQSRIPRSDDDDDDEFNFRRDTVNYQDDFNTSGESDDDASDRREKFYNMGYRPLKSYQPSFSAYSSSEVDKGINFTSLKHGTSPYSRYSDHQSSSSDRVKIEKSSYKNDPPFGRGPEQLLNVASSIDGLISGVNNDEVKNMPVGRNLALLTTQEDSKKRKKKKKSSKDDVPVRTDENGNPLVENPLTSAYKQMREAPSSGGSTVANHCETNYAAQSPDNNGPRPYSSSNHRDTDNDATSKLRLRRKKKTEDKKTAEDIENYQGNKSIEELMRFIGGQNESSKKSKKNSPVNEDITNKTQKSNKKNKDKKQKSPSASSSLEGVESKEGGSTKDNSLVNQGSEDNMGNSSGKTDCVDIPNVKNGDIDGLIPHNKDKLSKALLKDNDIDGKSSIHVNNDTLFKGSVICRESVKDKEPSSTNNKRDIVSLTSSVDNIKKKSEKSAKASKAEKSEMPASKSEEVFKVEHSLPNNVTVKQKNTKNKKTKTASPTVKLEDDITVPETDRQSVLTSFSNETIGQDRFIFTDLDVPQVPKEDEFQLVGKKKKKGTKEVEKSQNNFVANYTKPSRRHDDKRHALSHVSNKINIAQTPSGENDTHIRDLSPSAFPALRQSIQEGRRNSTGDVPIPSVLKSQDDSDLESVKSLPATQGSQTVESILSPRLSYAKMAAGSKVNDSSCSSDKRSSLDSGDSDYDLKKSMWKGSPTERRHSIGSSPEEVNKLTGSPSAVTATTVKAGSQEHIAVDVGIESVPNSVKVLSPDIAGVVVDSNVKSHDEEYRVLNENDKIPSENPRTISVSQVVSSLQPSISPSRNIDNATVNSVSHSQLTVDSKQSPVNVVDTEMNSSSVINNRNSSIAIPNVHKQETSRCKSSTSSNNRKQKSVIFLDKRVESLGNLGISFGFEDKDEDIKPDCNDPMELNDQSDYGPKTCDSNVENSQTFDFINSPDLNLEPKDLVDNESDKSKSISSSTSVISDSNSTSEIAKSYSSNSEISGDKKVAPAQIVRMNGIVAPQGHSSKLSNEIQEVKEEVSILAGSENSVDIQQAIPESRLNEVFVYYGEGVVTLKKDVVVPSLTNGPTSYCGLMKFIEETNLRSNFNVAEAAAFFTREWDRTVKLLEKEPDTVTIHQE
ncbi:hypothetical protein ACF0H5_017454 [Mactra antiquata]